MLVFRTRIAETGFFFLRTRETIYATSFCRSRSVLLESRKNSLLFSPKYTA